MGSYYFTEPSSFESLTSMTWDIPGLSPLIETGDVVPLPSLDLMSVFLITTSFEETPLLEEYLDLLEEVPAGLNDPCLFGELLLLY